MRRWRARIFFGVFINEYFVHGRHDRFRDVRVGGVVLQQVDGMADIRIEQNA